MTMVHEASRRAVRPRSVVAALACAAGVCGAAHAAWNPAIGYKDDNDHAIQATPYTFNLLSVVGGRLDFNSSVNITNEYVRLEPLGGWNPPQLFAFGGTTFTTNSIHSLNNSVLHIQPGAPCSITTTFLEVSNGARFRAPSVTVTSLTKLHGASAGIEVESFQQTGGDFDLSGAGSYVLASASFDFTGVNFKSLAGTFVCSSPPPTGLVTADNVVVNGFATAVNMISKNTAISGTSSFLRITGNYVQNSGDFSIGVGGGFQGNGDFDFMGNAFTLSGNSFNLLAPATSSVTAQSITIQGNATRTIGTITANGNVSLLGGTLHVLGDYTQNVGATTVSSGATLLIDQDLLQVSTGNTWFIQPGAALRVGRDIHFSETAIVSLGTTSVGDGTNGVAGTVRVGTGGALRGHGVVNSTTFVESGAASPGFPAGNAVGTLSFLNNYTQGAGGSFDMDIGGAASADRLSVFGQGTLGGALNINVLSRYAPQWGDAWTAVSCPTLAGDFATFSAPALGSSLFWWVEANSPDYTVGVRLHADTNHDDVVNFVDLNNVLSFYGASGVGSFGRPFSSGDTNEDGVVNFTDLNNVLSFFGQSAPPAP